MFREFVINFLRTPTRFNSRSATKIYKTSQKAKLIFHVVCVLLIHILNTNTSAGDQDIYYLGELKLKENMRIHKGFLASVQLVKFVLLSGTVVFLPVSPKLSEGEY